MNASMNEVRELSVNEIDYVSGGADKEVTCKVETDSDGKTVVSCQIVIKW
ncbi:hypothetical protein [Brevundimonas diminuta]|nr:hypothetical protein [Brevundimonas diminuta]